MNSRQRWFVTILALAWLGSATLTTAGADVRGYSVLKGHFLLQYEPGPPETDPDFAYSILVSIDLTDFDLVTNASVRLPSGTLKAMDNLADAWAFLDTRNSLSALNSAYGWGSYTVAFGAINDGDYSCVLNLPNTPLPPAPELTNFDAVQAVNPLHPLTLHWDYPSTPDPGDFVQVYITDGHFELFSTPDLGAPGALDGAARSVTIPAGTLDPGSTVSLNLEITRVVSTNATAYPWAEGIAATFRSTAIDLTTIVPPRMKILSPTNGVVAVEVRGLAGKTNILQSTEDLVTWRNQATNVAPLGKSVFNVPTTDPHARFFRTWQP